MKNWNNGILGIIGGWYSDSNFWSLSSILKIDLIPPNPVFQAAYQNNSHQKCRDSNELQKLRYIKKLAGRSAGYFQYGRHTGAGFRVDGPYSPLPGFQFQVGCRSGRMPSTRSRPGFKQFIIGAIRSTSAQPRCNWPVNRFAFWS